MTHPDRPEAPSLRDLLNEARGVTGSHRDVGTFFERVARAYLLNDPMQAPLHEEVLPYADWAERQGLPAGDHGIDLVARLAGDEGYAAIQCKYRAPDQVISKADLDSFLAASSKAPFIRRIVIDSTERDWSEPARATAQDQMIPVLRVGLQDLETSPILWASLRGEAGRVETLPGKKLRPHQAEALTAVREGLAQADRGKLIMACGTGKTFTALKISEVMAGKGGRVLVLVPSLALMAQTVREWTADCALPLRSFAVCSDSQVGKRRIGQADIAEIDVLDLAFPATTNAEELALRAKESAAESLCVVFGTYQSLDVIATAQSAYGLPAFDLIICDEAHRTTGATLDGEDASGFVKVHDNTAIRGRKRLYMTATPRIYGDQAKTKAQEVSAELASMDDPAIYGETLFYRGFSWAVEQGLLTDYRVIVLAVDEGLVSASVQDRLADAENGLNLDDATRIIGCYKALAKEGLVSAGAGPMRRGIAFCRDIKSSKLIKTHFADVVQDYLGPLFGSDTEFQVAVEHVDGTMGARQRGAALDWLNSPPGGACHILSNARCLSEGVDVPSLDAILFLHPRNSQIDVVQSVGRVMRKAPGKTMGYVILPIGIPPGVAPEVALRDNKRYRVVWQVLNALRSHDERLDATINQAGLGQDVSDRIEIVGVSAPLEAALPETAIIDQLPAQATPPTPGVGEGGERDPDPGGTGTQIEMAFTTDTLAQAVKARLVEKCGTRDYWEDWAESVGQIAQAHITRLTTLVNAEGSAGHAAFQAFLSDLHRSVNSAITSAEAIEMLAQHLVTRPVFETLFAGDAFVARNPVSKALSGVLAALEGQGLEKETEDLEGFYTSVQRRTAGITDSTARQALIVELYDTFFRRAFPKTTARLGIVYTPVEVVDFILHSVEDILTREFDSRIADRDVHILDPFTGTGTFVTRLLQSGLIPPEAIARKLREDIHANEIVLLAYYIAAINVETVAQALRGPHAPYTPFDGICLTDTFATREAGDLITQLMPDNSERITQQKRQDITVIVGNPPYSAGQRSQDDDAGNIAYPDLDTRIRETYAAKSEAKLLKGIYDSYIRAIRWASDRIGDRGVIGFVTNAGWLDGNAMDGLRKCLTEEFTSLYVLNLRGNARSSGVYRQKEAGNVFGEGSRSPIAISLLVKNPDVAEQGQIFYHDIGDYLKREEKLSRIARFGSIAGLRGTGIGAWTRITPDRHGDWLDQRDDSFGAFLRLGSKTPVQEPVLFDMHSLGIVTNRDAWCYNPSKARLHENVDRSIEFYNAALAERRTGPAEDGKPPAIPRDPTRISWTRALEADLKRGKPLDPDDGVQMQSLYRPFTKQWLHYSRRLNEMVYRMPAIFPEPGLENRVIAVTGIGARAGFSCLMADAVPNLHFMDTGQCFPLWRYTPLDEADAPAQGDMLTTAAPGEEITAPSGRRYRRQSAITEAALEEVRKHYTGHEITGEDVFHYLYGVLHSEDYRTRFAANLKKELPRLPLERTWEGFAAFREAGERLSALHTSFETVEPWPVTVAQGEIALAVIDDPAAFFRVEKMRFGGTARTPDKTTVHYNANITIENIPPEAWNYEVNGKPALTWIMERQQVKTDKASGIVSDPNAWAVETMADPAYPYRLFCQMITVAMETQTLVRDMPNLDLRDL